MMKNTVLLLVALFLLSGCSSVEPPKPLSEIPYIDTGIDANRWALIPAGEFYEGQHLHPVNIDYDYEIMVTDVTNQQFANFLNQALAEEKIKLNNDMVTVY